MDKEITHKDFVSYAQYQKQFEDVIKKYHLLYHDNTFDVTHNCDFQKQITKLIFDNFN